MNRSRRSTTLTLGLTLALGLTGFALPGAANAQTVSLRIGSVVPKNSLYHRQLLELGEAWRAAQGGDTRFTVFTDGSQGGEAELSRRMRIGQLQGALMSVVGCARSSPASPRCRACRCCSAAGRRWTMCARRCARRWSKRFADKGFVVIGWGDAGWVRFFSKEPALRPADFKGRKFFAWGSEPEQQAIMKSLGYTPVPLETGDILPAMQTGMISVLPSTPYFALASQVYGTAGHMLEINWAPIVGALVVTKKAWDTMSPAGQQALRRPASRPASACARRHARRWTRPSPRWKSAACRCTAPTPSSCASGTNWPPACTRASAARWCRRRPSTRCSPT
jgi:TRAP-type C4-dicarboxylate transport system substrate-binding protein